jgi:hypothetical protein
MRNEEDLAILKLKSQPEQASGGKQLNTHNKTQYQI